MVKNTSYETPEMDALILSNEDVITNSNPDWEITNPDGDGITGKN